jgi:hypothetical protein
MPRGTWVYVGGRAGNKPSPSEKAAITTACEKLISDVLLPRFLPEIHPKPIGNYPVAILGKWHGNKYRFLTRYQSDDPNSYQHEFEWSFARIDYVNQGGFDLFWHRYNGEWHCLQQHISLEDALALIGSDPLLQPC